MRRPRAFAEQLSYRRSDPANASLTTSPARGVERSVEQIVQRLTAADPSAHGGLTTDSGAGVAQNVPVAPTTVATAVGVLRFAQNPFWALVCPGWMTVFHENGVTVTVPVVPLCVPPQRS
jgi:hypothetical protein